MGTVYIEVRNLPPTTPWNLGPEPQVSGAFTRESAPTLTFEQTDLDAGDTVQYSIQIDDSSDFSSPVIDYLSAPLAPGAASFSVAQGAGSGSYTAGMTVLALPPGPYYWRVHSVDSLAETSADAVAHAGDVAFIVNEPPEIAMTAPFDGSVHESVAMITGTGFDPDGTLLSVDVTLLDAGTGKYYDESTFGSDVPVWLTASTVNDFERWVFDTTGFLQDGTSYTAQARATDFQGQVIETAEATFLISVAEACSPPRVCHTLSVESGGGQSGTVGSALSLPLVARVLDPNGAPAAGVEVVWEAVSQGASVDPGASTSDSLGRVWTSTSLGLSVGINSDIFTVAIVGKPGTTVAFFATAYDESPAQVGGIEAILDLTPESASAPAIVTFSAARSVPSLGATLLSYRWDYGDGRAVSGAENELTGIFYTEPGGYSVELEIRDTFGKKAETKSYLTIRSGSSMPPQARIEWEVVDAAAHKIGFTCACSDSDGAGPKVVEANATVIWSFDVALDETAEPSVFTVDAVCWLRMADGRLLSVAGADSPGTLDILPESLLSISSVTSNRSSVAAGEQALVVGISLRHFESHSILGAELIFTQQGNDVSEHFTATPLRTWPLALPGNGQATLPFLVDASAAVSPGLVHIDAHVRARDAGDELRMLAGADAPWVWTVSAPVALRIIGLRLGRSAVYPGQKDVLGRLQVENISGERVTQISPQLVFTREDGSAESSVTFTALQDVPDTLDPGETLNFVGLVNLEDYAPVGEVLVEAQVTGRDADGAALMATPMADAGRLDVQSREV